MRQRPARRKRGGFSEPRVAAPCGVRAINVTAADGGGGVPAGRQGRHSGTGAVRDGRASGAGAVFSRRVAIA